MIWTASPRSYYNSAAERARLSIPKRHEREHIRRILQDMESSGMFLVSSIIHTKCLGSKYWECEAVVVE